MESQDNFYISLPSNSSFKFFPNNTLANFRVMLARPLQLTGNYEVALVEMYFSRAWSNVVGDEAKVIFQQNNQEPFTVVFDEGYYAEADSLMNEFNNKIKTYMRTSRKDFLKDELTMKIKSTESAIDIEDE